MMTQQETFDYVYRKIIEQGGPSVKSMGFTNSKSCVYRGEDDRRCAIGWLIPDELYQPTFDNGLETFGDIISCIKLPLDFTFYQELQACHDDAFFRLREAVNFIEAFKVNMAKFADNYGLVLPL
jgi:hypothetical protein